jgi:hypothetical protein
MKKSFLLSLSLLTAGSFADAKTFYTIRVYTGTQTGANSSITDYSISAGDSLKVTAWKFSGSMPGSVDSTIVVYWYLDSVYQFTAGGMATFTHPGLIYYKLHPDYEWYSDNAIRLSVATGIEDFISSPFPYPFNQLSPNVNLKNLNYTVIDLLGNIVDKGKFSGKIILRNTQPADPLPPGIYYVVYYDALDNRQVLTDKISYSRP